MSLFPDRSVTSASSRELTLIDQGLTIEQRKQLNIVTQSYLKSFNLIGYENTRAVVPVIRQCIIDGLTQTHKRELLLPTDNLSVAFKKGFDTRNSNFQLVEREITGLTDSNRFQGNLALPQDLVKSAGSELARKAFVVDPQISKRLTELAKIRRSIFQQLVQYCRDQVETAILGSSNVELDESQQAALVRHLVFSWVVYGEQNLLLETEDFMLEKPNYLDQYAKTSEESWCQLAKLAGLDENQTPAYLKDLSYQVADYLSNVPEKPIPETSTNLQVVSTINTAFKALENHFLVVNPFNKFPSLSENPNDRGRSIWDNNRSAVFTINDRNYRVPTTATLRLASFLISGQDPDRSKELVMGARAVETLLSEIATQREGLTTILSMQNEVEECKKKLIRTKMAIETGRVPSDAAISRADTLRFAQRQNNLMEHELRFFPLVRSRHEILTKRGLILLGKYAGGQSIEKAQPLKEVQNFYWNQVLLRNRVLNLTRERLAPRIIESRERLDYLKRVEIAAGENYPVYLKTEFPDTFHTTVLDLLDYRGRLWMHNYLGISAGLRYTGEGKLSKAINNWISDRKVYNESNYLPEDSEIYEEAEIKQGADDFIREKAKIKYGTTKVILTSLLRLAPELLWPDYPVDINAVIDNKFPEDKTDPFFYVKPGEKLHEEHYPEVSSKFRDWLSQSGLNFEDNLYSNLVRNFEIANLIKNAHIYHRFFGIEQQLQEWYSIQRNRILDQVKSYKGNYYRIPPTHLVNHLANVVASKEIKLRNVKAIAARRLASKVAQLQGLGLIRPEES